MRCPYCGKELINGAKFCDGCGAQLEVQQPQFQQQPQQMNYGYGYGYPQPPKKGKGSLVAIIIMAVIILAGVGFGIWYFALRDSGDDNNTNTNVNTNTSVNVNTNTNTHTNTNTNTVVNPPVSSGETVSFLGYTLTVPSGYESGVYSGNDYIESADCVIMYLEYSLSYDMITANVDSFIQSFKDQGFVLKSSGTKTYNGNKYFVMTGTLNNVDYGYMFGSLKGTKDFFVTITAQDLGEIKEQWFVDAGNFFASAK